MLPAMLFSTVVLVTRRVLVLVTLRVLSESTYMPPAKVAAVLPTTLEFSTLITTPISPQIPPAHSKPQQNVSA